MRVLFISTILGYPWGGADVLWTRTAEALSAEGHALGLALSKATAAHARIQQLVATGASFYERRGFCGGQPASLVRRLLRRHGDHDRRLLPWLQNFRPDAVVISQGGVYDATLDEQYVRWLIDARVPYVLICQANADGTQLTEKQREAAVGILDGAREALFVSTHNRRLAERQLGAALSNAALVQNPMECSDCASLGASESKSWAFVGRLDAHDKGLDVLVAAVAAARDRGSRLAVTMYGSGRDEAYLRKLIRHYGIEDLVELAGRSNDVRQVWKRHAGLVLPSRVEGCALAMLEAMACGRPILTTRVGGVDDWCEDGVEGFIAAAPTVELVASTIERAVAEASRWPSMGDAARARFVRQADPAPERRVVKALSGLA